MHGAFDRKDDRKSAALVLDAEYFQFGLMAYCDVFDDRQPQSRATGFAGAAAVYPIETFRQSRYVTRRDADTAVLYREYRLLAAFRPAHQYLSAGRGVTYRVAEQIAERAAQFVVVAQ